MAARLILSGVGKSGSPAPKSTTSTPCARNFSASAATFMVDDTLIKEIRSAISRFVCTTIIRSSLPLAFSKPLPQPYLHRRRHQPADITAQSNNLLHQPRADERVRL